MSEKSNIPDCLDWRDADFKAARLRMEILRRANPDAGLDVRQQNLDTVSRVLEDCNIPFWIHGKTLLGIYRDGEFIAADHDDDVGVFAECREDVCTRVYPQLKDNGFEAIRVNDAMLSVIRNDRYVDICFFKRKRDKVGYGQKWFAKEHFEKLDSLTFHGREYPIPHKTKELLQKMYPEKSDEPSVLAGLYRPVKKIKRKIKRARKWIKSNIIQKKILRPLSLEEFLDLKIEDDAAVNWTLRGPHLDVITDNGRLRTIGEIVQHFESDSELEDTKVNRIVETDTSEPFEEPVNLNDRFWQTGNNYLFYCIYYGFRKDPVSYEKANDYIRSAAEPKLYSAEYFEQLPTMSDPEIEQFLQSAPLVVNRGSVVHGKHRVCAMIGRIATGKAYIPFYVEEHVSRLG